MTQEHPITPSPELVVEWADTIYQQTECDDQRDLYVATQAARWGADQELEACCEWISEKNYSNYPFSSHELRSARRPKPPSLKETLLARVARIPGEGADAAYLRHWVNNESQRLVDLLHEVFKSLPS
jgi:hypothetical protein